MGLFKKLKENACEKELAQRVEELRTIMKTLKEMNHELRLLLGDRLNRTELEIAKSRGVPVADVYSATGPCWLQRGGIIGDARATAKRMKDRLSSRDGATVSEAYVTVVSCDLIMILYRLAILEHGSQDHEVYCANVRGYIAELIASLCYCAINDISEQYVETVIQDFDWRLRGLPWNLRPAGGSQRVKN
jgi:hypothetical protein